MKEKKTKTNSSTQPDSRKKYESKYALKTTIRLTREQKELIDEKRGDLSIPEYFLQTALKSKIKGRKTNPETTNLKKETLLELHRIGNNLNQMTRFFNSNKSLSIDTIDKLEKEFNNTLPQFARFLRKVLNA